MNTCHSLGETTPHEHDTNATRAQARPADSADRRGSEARAVEARVDAATPGNGHDRPSAHVMNHARHDSYRDPDDAPVWQHIVVLMGWVLVVIALTAVGQ